MRVIWLRWDLSCAECAMTQPMQPCEACPNWEAQFSRFKRDKK